MALHRVLLYSLWLWSCCGAQNILCPEVCTCLGSAVDCSNKNLAEIPSLPPWVVQLDLRSNKIHSLEQQRFSDLQKLEDIDLSGNLIEEIPAGIFQNLSNLKQVKLDMNGLTGIPALGAGNLTQLTLEDNRIEKIELESLESLPSLRVLDLTNNRLTEIKAGSFPQRNSLHQLNMSGNKISAIEPGCFDDLSSLEMLKLSKNKIGKIPPNSFKNLKKLKYLEINRNRLGVLDGLTFQGLEGLEVLKLRRSGINELMDGVFFGLTHVQSIHLDGNNISSVTKGWLYGLNSLRVLVASNNAIRAINRDGWDFCPFLQELDLSHNKMAAIEEAAFEGLHRLKYLHYHHNHVTNIADDAFKGLDKLETLDLNYNDISSIIEDKAGAFQGLIGLKKLKLKGNKITSVAKNALSGLTSLLTLDLSDNAITTIENESFHLLGRLEEIYMNSSSLLCDCQLRWFQSWLYSNQLISTVKAKCSFPREQKGRLFSSVPLEQLVCDCFPKPFMLTDPENVMALRGDNVTFYCSVASSSSQNCSVSPMKIHWKKGRKKLLNLDQKDITNISDGQVTQYTASLKLTNVTEEDEGKYQCIAENAMGSDYSQKASLVVYMFPSFTKTPVDVKVKAGQQARLDCAATGHPTPTVAWQKDGGGSDFPAALERRIKVIPNDDVYFITLVKVEDAGVYSCMAENAAGRISANFTLTVEEKPSFAKPMGPVSTQRGDNTVLECRGLGSPPPSLTWFRDGAELAESQRHLFTAQKELLIIVNTEEADQGTYTCQIANKLGVERGSSVVTVVSGQPATGGGGDHPFMNKGAATGVITIAVVCCIVGTSLVWVIIIYQTRKQRAAYSNANTDETTLPPEISSSSYPPSSSEAVLQAESGSTGSRGRRSHSPSASDSSDLDLGGARPPYRMRGTAAIFPSDTEIEARAAPLAQGLSSDSSGSGSFHLEEEDGAGSHCEEAERLLAVVVHPEGHRGHRQRREGAAGELYRYPSDGDSGQGSLDSETYPHHPPPDPDQDQDQEGRAEMVEVGGHDLPAADHNEVFCGHQSPPRQEALDRTLKELCRPPRTGSEAASPYSDTTAACTHYDSPPSGSQHSLADSQASYPDAPPHLYENPHSNGSGRLEGSHLPAAPTYAPQQLSPHPHHLRSQHSPAPTAGKKKWAANERKTLPNRTVTTAAAPHRDTHFNTTNV